MSENYLAFILAYDYGYIFDRMELACDEAYSLALEIIRRFKRHCEQTKCGCYYDTLCLYVASISFEKIWETMKGY